MKAAGIAQFKEMIRTYTGGRDQLFFHKKGRVSLYAILKAMGVKEGDEVIVPAFTCIVVPNPIMYLGAKPVYVDIDPQTYNIDSAKVEEKITERTRVIMCQNTYGLTSGLDELLALAAKHKLYTIEDCTHGFGGTYKGKANGTSCDAAFFSGQWNKPFSTGLGGFALINNEALVENMMRLDKELIPMSAKDRWSLRMLYTVKKRLLTESTYWKMMQLYRWLSKRNLVLGSSSGGEIEGVEMPQAFFTGFSDVQAKEGIKNLKKLDEVMLIRKRNAEIYTQFLESKGKNHVPFSLFEDHSFLKYPLLVKNRDAFLELAEKNRIPMGDWFISPLHPVKERLSRWHFEEEHYPVAVEKAQQMINLPTDLKSVEKVLVFLEKHLDQIH